jgi:hypothetical protein
LSTYTFAPFKLLPDTDSAQCLAFLNTDTYIGGTQNIVYVWDGSSPFSTFIPIAESGIVQIVCVNTNAYIFAGRRGNIYITNGSQADVWKKIPDHVSGTVQPYFTWQSATSSQNELYCSFWVTANKNVGVIPQYGGLWAINLDTKAMRLANQLSFGTYAGWATCLIADYLGAVGTGIIAGWNSGSSTYGIDIGSQYPYTGSQASIDTDLVPIGTYTKTRNFTRLEYRLTRPLVSGESITIKSRLIFNTRDTGYSAGVTDSTAGHYSASFPTDFKNAQWVQFQITMSSTNTTPSYVRLRQLRIQGLVGPTLGTNQVLSL